MRKNSRAKQIHDAAISELKLDELEYDNATLSSAELLRAIAAMVAEATKKPEAKKKPPLLFDEKAVLQALNYDLQVARHGPLNRTLRRLDLLDGDLEKFRTWFDESMYPWLRSKEIDFTYSMLVRKFPEWLERARQHRPGGTAQKQASNWVV